MPKIDIDAAPTGHGTGYPEEFAGPCKARRRWRLGDAVGLDQFGVNLLRLPAGAWSSQRHWHEGEDEFVWVVSGEVVLVEDDGETLLRAGDCAGWKAGVPNGHKIENRSGAEAGIPATILTSTWFFAVTAISTATAHPIRKSTAARDRTNRDDRAGPAA